MRLDAPAAEFAEDRIDRDDHALVADVGEVIYVPIQRRPGAHDESGDIFQQSLEGGGGGIVQEGGDVANHVFLDDAPHFHLGAQHNLAALQAFLHDGTHLGEEAGVDFARGGVFKDLQPVEGEGS